MQIDNSDKQRQNALVSMRDRVERDSNVTVARDRQAAKQFAPSVPTDAGIEIDESEQQSENA
jgi:hypothetical protein